jgi:pimeloyl-ACP methyl ester carboxylesterase
MQIVANGIGIELDDQGPAGAEPLLLIMGLGMQLIGWPDELVQLLVSRGFRVIRPDNRDVGLSQGFDHLGVPNLPVAAMRHALRLQVHAPYSIGDMADDALGVLDALGIAQAHVCGASMGGMIAQHLAARHPQRVKSLTLMMTTSGSRRLPQAPWSVQKVLMSRPDGSDAEAVVAHLLNVMSVIGSPAYPPEPARLQRRLRQSVQRAWRPAGTARQLAAVAADGDRTTLLLGIKAPTLVIHGEADPLVPVAAGRDLAQRIAGAQSDFIPGMGHDLPLQLLPRLADGITANARRA